MKKTIPILLAVFIFNIAYATKLKASEKITHNEKPLLFMENKGQVADITGNPRSDINFTLTQKGVKLFFTNTGIYYQFSKFKPNINKDNNKTELFRLDMQLVGSNPKAKILPLEKSTYYENFFLTNCPKGGVTGVRGFSKLTYQNIYPHIDWVLYVTDNALKYDFVVRPGGNPNQIKIRYNNPQSSQLNADGTASIKTPLGEIAEGAPVCWTFEDGKNVKAQFSLSNNEIGFELNNYDKNQTLIIDPTLVWSRYFGGFGDDRISKISANIASGTTTSTFGIVVGSGYQTINKGLEDAFYFYYDPNLTGNISYCTYFGGSGNDRALSSFYSADGTQSKVCIAGVTESNGLVPSGSISSDSTLDGSSDGFVSIFLASGNLLYSTYVGGSAEDTLVEIKNTSSGNGITSIAISGSSNSADITNQINSFQGTSDGFLGLLSISATGISLTKSCYFGGANADLASSLSVGKDKNYFISGITSSTSGIATAGAYDIALGGITDAFVARFDSNFVLQWATYYGGSLSEYMGSNSGAFIATDSVNNVYLTGTTASFDINAPFTDQGKYKNSNQGNNDMYLIKFNQNGQKQWWTYFGGGIDDVANAIALSTNNKILVGGWTTSPSLDVDKNGLGLLGTSGHLSSDIDALLVEFNTSGNFKWSSPFGSTTGFDFCTSVYINAGIILFAGYTNSPSGLSYPTPSSLYSASFDGFMARIDDYSIKTLSISASSLCPGDLIDVPYQAIGDFPPGTNFSANLYTNFSQSNPVGLGNDTSGTGIIHGLVQLYTPQSFSGNSIKVESNMPPSFNINSTSQPVGAIGALPIATVTALTSTNICDGSTVVLKSPSNTNIVFRQWQKLDSLSWINIAGANSISYTVDSAGSYRVITTSVTGCDATSDSIDVKVLPIPAAIISGSSQLFCLGNNLVLTANSGSGLSYQWFNNTNLIANQNSDSLSVTTSGNFTLKVTNAVGCSTTSAGFIATGLLKPYAHIDFEDAQQHSEICVGMSSKLGANNDPGLSYQWYRNDTLLPGATLRTYLVTKTGDYFVKELNTNNCDSTSNSIHINVYDYPNPILSHSGLPYTCLGNSVSLTTSLQNNYSYQWLLNGIPLSLATDTFYNATTGGKYEVIATSHAVCSDTSNSIQINPVPAVTQLCFATIDTGFGGDTVVKLFWQKPAQDYVKGYVIYREIAGQGFVALDTVSNALFSSYTDTSANPTQQPERYKITTLDSCGTTSDINLSTVHQTILLQGSIDITGALVNLDWDAYLGIDEPTRFYRIMRDNLGNGVWDSIGATPWSITALNSGFADLYPNANYAVDLVWQGNCTPSQKMMTGFSKTRSNIKNKNAFPIGIPKKSILNTFIVYPNPATKFVTIEFESNAKNAAIFVSDLLGQSILEKQLDVITRKTQVQLNLESIRPGIYFINLQTEEEKSVVKFVVE